MSVKLICDYCRTEINVEEPLVLEEQWSDNQGSIHTTTYHFHFWECLVAFARKKHAAARAD